MRLRAFPDHHRDVPDPAGRLRHPDRAFRGPHPDVGHRQPGLQLCGRRHRAGTAGQFRHHGRAGRRSPRVHQPLALGLAHPVGGRLAPLGPQHRHSGAPHRVHDLCDLGGLRGLGRLPDRRAARRRRSWHRGRAGDRGAHGRRRGRQQPRRGTRVRGQGADGRRHHPGADQRPDPPRFRVGIEPDGARPHAGACGGAGRPLAQEPAQGAGQGLCGPDLQPHGSGRHRRAGFELALRARQSAQPPPSRSASGRSRDPKT